MGNTDSGVQRAEQLCGGHEHMAEKAETALRWAGSRKWGKGDVIAGADEDLDMGLKGQQDQWDQALSHLKAAAPATFPTRM